MTSKTSLEVQDTDLLVIEDEEDTKSITVAAFKQALQLAFEGDIDKKVKVAINETITNIVDALEKCKYTFIETKHFLVNTWIDSASGDIQIAILNTAGSWLTSEELVAMTMPDEDGTPTHEFVIEIMTNDVWDAALSENIVIKDFNTEYTNSHEINAWMAEENAGFIRVHFDGLSQNDIAGIEHDDVRVILPQIEDVEYTIETSEDTFSNAVPYVDFIPDETEPGLEDSEV